MKRFLAVLVTAAVASFVYVATAPGSQFAGPTAKQFAALTKQVANLSKKVKAQGVAITTLKERVATQATTITTLGGQLTALQTDESAVKTTATNDDAFIRNCLVTAGVAGVSAFGDPNQTFGYRYFDGTNDFFTTALDFDPSGSPDVFFQAVAPSCVSTGSASPQAGQLTEPRKSH